MKRRRRGSIGHALRYAYAGFLIGTGLYTALFDRPMLGLVGTAAGVAFAGLSALAHHQEADS